MDLYPNCLKPAVVSRIQLVEKNTLNILAKITAKGF